MLFLFLWIINLHNTRWNYYEYHSQDGFIMSADPGERSKKNGARGAFSGAEMKSSVQRGKVVLMSIFIYECSLNSSTEACIRMKNTFLLKMIYLHNFMITK